MTRAKRALSVINRGRPVDDVAWLCAASKQHTYETCVPFDKRGAERLPFDKRGAERLPFDKRGAERLPFDKSRPSSETEGLGQMSCRMV